MFRLNLMIRRIIPLVKLFKVEIINNVKSFIAKTFFSEIPEVEPDAQEAKNNSEIQSILNMAWEGKLQEEEKKSVISFLQSL